MMMMTDYQMGNYSLYQASVSCVSSPYDTNLRHLQRDAKLIADLWPIR